MLPSLTRYYSNPFDKQQNSTPVSQTTPEQQHSQSFIRPRRTSVPPLLRQTLPATCEQQKGRWQQHPTDTPTQAQTNHQLLLLLLLLLLLAAAAMLLWLLGLVESAVAAVAESPGT